MKLISRLKDIIFESSRGNKVVDRFNYDDKEILLTANYHQWKERFGIKSFEEILDIYDNDDSLKLRIGVPNEMISFFFQKNFEKIVEKFNEIESKSSLKPQRILIIKNRKKQNVLEDNPEFFDFAEFIVQKNSQYWFEIITSAFSKDGFFLKLFDKTETSTPRLTVENKFYFNSTLIV